MNKLQQIFKGFIFYVFSKNQKMYDNKYRFCKVCTHRGKYFKEIDKCNLCGCVLQAKLRTDSECPINKF